MIDFLKNENILEETISYLNKYYDNTSLMNLYYNKSDCIKIIKYMKSIGINNIDQLLMYKLDLFVKSFEYFHELISKFNISDIVELINNDCTVIDEIYE